MAVKIHPAVDSGVKAGVSRLRRRYAHLQVHVSPVTVTLKGNVVFNHVCGCTQVLEAGGRIVLADRGDRHATT